MTLEARARAVRDKAPAPYSGFIVGAALRTEDGEIFAGCNVENAAYSEATCAEVGAIAAMVAGGGPRISEIDVVARGPIPVSSCGGCRQRITKFAGPEIHTTIGALSPGAFSLTGFGD